MLTICKMRPKLNRCESRKRRSRKPSINAVQRPQRSTRTYINILLRWQAQEEDWIALNIDASFKGSGAGGGGIVAINSEEVYITEALFRSFAINAIEAKWCTILKGINWSWTIKGGERY